MPSRQSREIRLARRPEGPPGISDFVLAETELPAPDESQVLVHNIWMSVDLYMWDRMLARES